MRHQVRGRKSGNALWRGVPWWAKQDKKLRTHPVHATTMIMVQLTAGLLNQTLIFSRLPSSYNAAKGPIPTARHAKR